MDQGIKQELLEIFRQRKLASGVRITYHEAKLLSHIAHSGQYDKVGVPYHYHTDTVGSQARAQHGDSAGIVGQLHDAMDDCPIITESFLLDCQLLEAEVSALLKLRRPEGMTLQQSLEKLLRGNKRHAAVRLSWQVKDIDLLHNTRTPALPTQSELTRSAFYAKKRDWFKQQIELK